MLKSSLKIKIDRGGGKFSLGVSSKDQGFQYLLERTQQFFFEIQRNLTDLRSK